MKISPNMANESFSERYARHRLIDGFDQDRLAEVDVIVIGAGAVGNEVIKNLALLGIGKIEIHDFDLIEIHNLTRSILFNDELIGRSKAEVAAEACGRIDPNITVRGFFGDFRDRLTVERVRSANAVLCCVDNHEARIHLNRLCLLAGTPLLNAAIDAWEVSSEIYPHSQTEAVACYECWIPSAIYTTINERYSCGGLRKVSIEQRRIPTTILTSSMAGAALVSLLLQHVCDFPSRRRVSVQSRSRLKSLTADERTIVKNPDCPACRTYAGALMILPCSAVSLPNMAELDSDEEPYLILSEPIITGWSCRACGNSQSLLARARDYDTSLIWCPDCHAPSRTVSIIEESTPTRLAEISRGMPLPIQFLYCPSSKPRLLLSLTQTNLQVASET